MTDLRQLYQETLLDHGKNPRNFGVLEPADHSADGDNPLCGDKITVYVRCSEGRLAELRFRGSGCAISTASASIMTETLRGRTVEEARRIFDAFHAMVAGEDRGPTVPELPEKLRVFSGVREFPVRVKCATLAWHTLRAALSGDAAKVTTESTPDASNEVYQRQASEERPRAEISREPPGLSEDQRSRIRSSVIEALKTCYDPEIPVDIYELGLIYHVEVDRAARVAVQMTLTSPACPVAGSLPGEVEQKVRGVSGVREAQVELVWDPPWDREMMSDAAKLKLGFF